MQIIKLINQIPWSIVVLLCLTLGLAPLAPPHVWEKLQMLGKGELTRPIDWFDFIFHSIPWLILILKSPSLFPSKQ